MRLLVIVMTGLMFGALMWLSVNPHGPVRTPLFFGLAIGAAMWGQWIWDRQGQ